MSFMHFQDRIIAADKWPWGFIGAQRWKGILSLQLPFTAGNVSYVTDLQFKEQGGTQTSMGPLSASFTPGNVSYTTDHQVKTGGGTSSKSYSETLPFTTVPSYTISTNLVAG